MKIEVDRGMTAPNRRLRQRERIASAAQDRARVHGWTHNFYRYPARFSPVFARSVIDAYSDPGDWVIDPFVGGGTTLVEAMALGRHSLGIDVSALATFICTAKTLVMTDEEIRSFENWRSSVPLVINMKASSNRDDTYAKDGYYRNIEGNAVWRVRKAIEQSLGAARQLHPSRSEILARCVVLRTAQWALDGRKKRPSVPEFREKMSAFAKEMLQAAMALRRQVEQHSKNNQQPLCVSLHRTTAGSHTDSSVRRAVPPRLILTSPPYPGIHMLYHRWQIDGRREAPAPFWIAGKFDGAGSSYYTMGDRKRPGLTPYFDQLEQSFRSVAAMAGRETTIVQVVAFSDAEWQLPRYLEVMNLCGLVEDLPWDQSGDGRLWRDVPNRKWHALQRAHSPGSREVVLVHQKRKITPRLQAPQDDCLIPDLPCPGTLT